MKRIIFIIFLFSISAFSQETLLPENFESGGFGGPVIKFTQIQGDNSVLIGGRGGWIIGHQLIVGGGGYGLANSIDIPEYQINNKPAEMHFGYGGLELEYIIKPSSLIHYSVYCLLGGGAVEYADNDGSKWSDSGDYTATVMDEFWVIEPAVHATINIATFFRISTGVSYRQVGNVKLAGTSNSDLSGPAFNITLRFGKF